MLSSLSAEPTLWQEIWTYITENYFSDDAGIYENLGFGSGGMISLRMIVFGLMIGMIVAAFAITADKRVLGNFVRKLLKEGVVGKENAKTLYDLGSLTSYTVRHSVRRSTNVRRVVKCLEEEEFYAEQQKKREEHEQKRREDPSLPPFAATTYRVDVEVDHFYIPEEMAYAAEAKFSRRGTTWLACFMMIIVGIFVCALLLFAVPKLLGLLNDLVGAISSTASSRVL